MLARISLPIVAGTIVILLTGCTAASRKARLAEKAEKFFKAGEYDNAKIEYLNVIKNSSLAVAIGYPDLVSVFAGTTLSQTGQAIEIIGITMGVYLLISLVTSAIMSFYSWRISRSMG